MKAEIKFEAPGPGPWEAETAHFPRPVTRFAAEGLVRAFPVGFAEGTTRYGLLLSHFKTALVNGFFYQQPVPFGAPEGAMGPPPKPVLWLLTRLVPKMRARIETCRKAFENKQWRSDLEQWDRVDKPAAIAKHRTIQAIDPVALSDDALIEHLRAVRQHHEDMILLHHRFTITACIPVGDYLSQAIELAKVSPGEALALLRGTSPISNGVAAQELDDLAKALQADSAARALLDHHEPTKAIEALSADQGEIGRRARAYLDVVRFRSVGYDLSDKNCGEMPELLMKSIRAALDGKYAAKALADRDEKEKALKERVPAEHRAAFEEALGEARFINRLRDERGVYSDGWGTGLTRRALLEAGTRLVAKGKLLDREHVVDLSLDEIIGLFGSANKPTPEEVKERVTWRLTKSVADIPPWLNAPPAPPPPADILPRAARRATKAVDAIISNLLKEADAKHSDKIVRGLSVNAGTHEGTARIVLDAADFEKLKQGDVLVTRATSPYFNVVLPLLGALVTDRGGQLCHAAIVAREYGIPGIVGTKEATRTIPDGARVRVDGTSGEVVILSAPS